MAGAENPMLPVRRVDATTDDIDMSAMFSQLYARHRPRIRRIAHARVDGRLRAAEAGPLNAGLVRQLGFDYAAEADPVDWLLSTVVLHGAVAVTTARERAAVTRGDVILYPLGAGFAVGAHDADAAALRIPLEAAAGLAEEQDGLPAAELRFESMSAVSAAARGLFARTTAFICDQLVTSDVTAVGPLVAEEMIRLAASALLTTFPNTTMTVPYLRGPGRVPASAARRAGPTVAAIARRWGFTRPDRFAAAYRAAYDQLPGHTLRHC